jgi:hypothetical protein
MMPDFTSLEHLELEIGSMGFAGDSETAGGGRVIILADSVEFTGHGTPVQANAKPYFNTPTTQSTFRQVGGSGGYIYVSTLNKLNEN